MKITRKPFLNGLPLAGKAISLLAACKILASTSAAFIGLFSEMAM